LQKVENHPYSSLIHLTLQLVRVKCDINSTLKQPF